MLEIYHKRKGVLIKGCLFFMLLLFFSYSPAANKPLPVKKWKSFTKKQENEKVIAVGLAVALGPFGAHRLYLGTKPHVPVVYTLTLGGFAIIPLVDMGHIIFSKDLTPYKNNPRVIMWKKEE